MTDHVFVGELARAHVHGLGQAAHSRSRRRRTDADEQPANRGRHELSWRGGPTMPGPPVLDDPAGYSVLDDPAAQGVRRLLLGPIGVTGFSGGLPGPVLVVRLLRLLVGAVSSLRESFRR